MRGCTEKIDMSIKEMLNTKKDSKIFEEMIIGAFLEALNESIDAGESIESVVYEMLEKIEAGLQEVTKTEKEVYLHQASDVILGVMQSRLEKQIRQGKRRVMRAELELKEIIDKEKHHIYDTLAACNHYAVDNRHRHMQSLLKRTRETNLEMLSLLIEGF